MRAFGHLLEIDHEPLSGIVLQKRHEARKAGLALGRVSHDVERDQVSDLAIRRSGRDQAAVDTSIANMLAAARSGANMIPAMLDAARAEATLGEICGALRAEWGGYSEAPAF